MTAGCRKGCGEAVGDVSGRVQSVLAKSITRKAFFTFSNRVKLTDAPLSEDARHKEYSPCDSIYLKFKDRQTNLWRQKSDSGYFSGRIFPGRKQGGLQVGIFFVFFRVVLTWGCIYVLIKRL